MINGCIPVVPTFFDFDRQIDLHSLDRCLDYLDTFGFEAYWILGTGGEDMSLTDKERFFVYQHLLKHKLAHKR